jgi:hypothetical protein
MALQLNSYGGVVAMGFDSVTGESGFLQKLRHDSGGASVAGTVVSNATGYNLMVAPQENEFDAVGVLAEDGVADGGLIWVWKNGSRCKVLLEDGEAGNNGYVAICAATNGRMKAVAVPSSNPVVAEHFKEIGHVCESASSGTSAKVLVDLHFN